MHEKLQCGHTRLHENCTYCIGYQRQWYAALKSEGFKDIESASSPNRPLKSWKSAAIQIVATEIDLIASQEQENSLQSEFPDSLLTLEQKLVCNPEFDKLCERLCEHGNHQLSAHEVKGIWLAYIDGGSNRSIAEHLNINDTLVWRTIKALSEWMNLMDLDAAEETWPLAKVVLRDFERKKDEAFIYASWRNALWYDDENRKEGDSDRFYRHATTSIRNIIDNEKTRVRIACTSDSPNFIVGYSVITGLCLHFVYVKADYRNKRIGSILVPRAVEMVSPILTKIGRAIAEKKGFVRKA